MAGVWAVVLSWLVAAGNTCPANGCASPLLQSFVPYLGIILVLVALVCFVGFRQAFLAGGVLAFVIAIIVIVNWGAHASVGYSLLSLVAVVALGIDILVMRSKSSMAEQGNPMNLPVFG